MTGEGVGAASNLCDCYWILEVILRPCNDQKEQERGGRKDLGVG